MNVLSRLYLPGDRVIYTPTNEDKFLGEIHHMLLNKVLRVVLNPEYTVLADKGDPIIFLPKATVASGIFYDRVYPYTHLFKKIGKAISKETVTQKLP
jgi:hypothetical protein